MKNVITKVSGTSIEVTFKGKGSDWAQEAELPKLPFGIKISKITFIGLPSDVFIVKDGTTEIVSTKENREITFDGLRFQKPVIKIKDQKVKKLSNVKIVFEVA